MKNCGDTGSPDSLRQVVAAAVSGDTVSVAKLPMYCGGSDTADATIALSGVEIATSLDDLNVEGPGDGLGSVTISGGDMSRVFNHSGAGTFTITHVTIAHGNVNDADAHGGCVSSHGDVALNHSTITGCSVVGTTRAAGGGLYVFPGTARLFYSEVSNNVLTVSGGTGGGAGVYAYALNALYSSLSDNREFGGSGGAGLATAGGALFLHASTVDHNQCASGGPAGVLGTRDVTISDSTISYNTAQFSSALTATNPQVVVVSNTTIASNHTSNESDQTAAIELHNGSFIFESSIVATNTAGLNNDEADLYSSQPIASPRLSGSHNIVGQMSATVTPPLGFSVDVNPLLGPLAFNGGPTRTQALLTGSPAIGAGGMPSPFVAYDQRGPGHPRSTITSSGTVTDIGAYGYETIFADGLD